MRISCQQLDNTIEEIYSFRLSLDWLSQASHAFFLVLSKRDIPDFWRE